MSLSDPARIDAVGVRDGWAVIAMHHFGEWQPLHERVEALTWKISAAQAHVATPGFQAKYHRLPVRLELRASEDPPPEVVALCARFGVWIADR